MNMIVSTAIAGAAVPAVAAEPDPIYAAIEAHRAAAIETSAVHALFAAFETELQANGRLQSERRTGEENRRQDELGQRFLGSNHIRRRRRVCRTMCGRPDGD
jgi:hypothetical protein